MGIIISKIYKKYAAVGRREMLFMFTWVVFIYLLQIITSGFLVKEELAVASAIHIGLVVGFFWILLINGIVGFQFVEDGSKFSMAALVSSTISISVGIFFICMDIPFYILGDKISTTMYQSSVLFGLYLMFPVVCSLFYIILTTFLVCKNLGEQKSLIYMYIAAFLFIMSNVFSIPLNETICLKVIIYILKFDESNY
jgi:hypothetical protein